MITWSPVVSLYRIEITCGSVAVRYRICFDHTGIQTHESALTSITQIVYFGRCLPWLLIDRMPYFRQWKIQAVSISSSMLVYSPPAIIIGSELPLTPSVIGQNRYPSSDIQMSKTTRNENFRG